MSQVLQLGPLSLPYSLLLILAAVLLANLCAKLLARRGQPDVEPQLFRLLLIALLGARLAFVWQFRQSYLAHPLDMLDIRDGGWDAQAGAIAAWAGALVYARRQPTLRKPLLSSMGLASAVWVAGSIALAATAPALAPMPQLQLQSLAPGSQSPEWVDLQSFQGKPTVINLWASWCPPCRREMPVLQRAQQEQRDVNIVFLNQGESTEVVQGFLQAQQLQLQHVLIDPKGQAGSAFKQRALPTTLFFDAQGRLQFSRVGELSHASLSEKLSRLRAAGAPM